MADNDISTSGSEYLTHTQQSRALTMQEPQSPFLRLPLETRRLIYRDLLVADAVSIALRPNEWNIHVNILRTCKKIYFEAREVLHNANCFIYLVSPNKNHNILRQMGVKWTQDGGALANTQYKCVPVTMAVAIGLVVTSRYISSGDRDYGLVTMGHLEILANNLTTMAMGGLDSVQLGIIPVHVAPWSHRYHKHIFTSLSQVREMRSITFKSQPVVHYTRVDLQIEDIGELMKQPLRRDDWYAQMRKYIYAYIECSPRTSVNEGVRRREATLCAKQLYDYITTVMDAKPWDDGTYKRLRNVCTHMVFSIIRTSKSVQDWKTVGDMVVILRTPDRHHNAIGPNRMAMFENKYSDILDLYRTFERDESILCLEYD